VGNVNELKLQADIVHQTAKQVFAEHGCKVDYLVGTMIELPRAALTADQIATVAQFFSFGTNDLTQTVYGLSRDDAGKLQADIVHQTAKQVFAEHGCKVDYLVGTMIELPRAALTADQIASVAQFFSFGTNDLTQTVYGLSRDDAGKFLPLYLEKKIIPYDPFVTIDFDGVGALMKIGVDKGRSVNANLKIGICGEHGGDPESVKFCHRLGMNYVSCSPFRVPIASIAAAQAALAEKVEMFVDK